MKIIFGKFLFFLLAIFLTILIVFLLNNFLNGKQKTQIFYSAPLNQLNSKKFTTNLRIDGKILYFNDTSKKTDSLPFVTGDTFRIFADAALDQIDPFIPEIVFNKKMPIILIKIDYLQIFFDEYFSKFSNKMIIITHNGANPVTEKYRKFLENEKIVAWFAQNPEFYHPKLIAIPVGFLNFHHSHEYFNILKNLSRKNPKEWNERKSLLYIHFNVRTNLKSRKKLLTRFQNFTAVKILNKRVKFEEFFKNLNDSKYVLCPRGSGIDTHRFYEAILMGAIPIVESSTLNPIYNQTTSLILPSFEILTEEMLLNPSNYIKNMNFNREIIFMEYWLKKIFSLRQNISY